MGSGSPSIPQLCLVGAAFVFQEIAQPVMDIRK